MSSDEKRWAFDNEDPAWEASYLSAAHGGFLSADLADGTAVAACAAFADATVAKLAQRRAARESDAAVKLEARKAAVLAQRTYSRSDTSRPFTVDRIDGVEVYFTDGSHVPLAELEDCGFSPIVEPMVALAASDDGWNASLAVATCLRNIASDLEAGVAKGLDPSCAPVEALGDPHSPYWPGTECGFRAWLHRNGVLSDAVDAAVAKVRKG